MSKLKHVICAAVIAAACVSLSSCDFVDRMLGRSETAAATVPEAATAPETTAATVETDAETSSGTEESDVSAQPEEEASGGNPEYASYIDLTVSGEKYFYENHEISPDELLALFDELEKSTVVRISDENASKKAYETVTKALEERELLFEEIAG